MKIKTILISLSFFLLSQVPVLAANDMFTTIFITESDEKEFGAFPIKREYLANAIRQISKGKPKGILLKFFIDLPKTESGDSLLSESLRTSKVVLQARIDNNEKRPNKFPDRFRVKKYSNVFEDLLAGTSGWIPLPSLSKNAFDIGFVDIQSLEYTPLFEKYKNHMVKSLTLCGLELAFGNTLKIHKKMLQANGKSVPIEIGSNLKIQYPNEDTLKFFTLSELMNNKIPKHMIENKVIILGYDGPKIHSLDTPIGKIKAHRLFCYGLFGLYEQLSR